MLRGTKEEGKKKLSKREMRESGGKKKRTSGEA